MYPPIGLFFLLCTLLHPPLASASKRARGVSFHSPSQYIQHWNAQPGSQVSWAYNWASATDPTFPKDLEYIPMLWSNESQFTAPWPQNVKAALARGASHLLAFNEPNSCSTGQSCISPANAVAAYREHMMPFAGQALLGAPAVSNGPTGLAWLKDFMGLCAGCRIDFVPIHWYGQATKFGYLYEYIQSASLAALGREIWVTELNAAGTLEEQTLFLQLMLPWLDSQSYIGRYAWFWCSPTWNGGLLVDENGWPTTFGDVYAYT